MGLGKAFKNVGHAFAWFGKNVQKVVVGAIAGEAKLEKFEPLAEGLIAALAGPQAAAAADLAFRMLGTGAAALQKVDDSALASVAEKGLNLQLDLDTLQKIKEFIALAEKGLNANGTPVPLQPTVPLPPGVQA